MVALGGRAGGFGGAAIDLGLDWPIGGRWVALRGSQASPGNNCLNRLHIKLSQVCPLG